MTSQRRRHTSRGPRDVMRPAPRHDVGDHLADWDGEDETHCVPGAGYPSIPGIRANARPSARSTTSTTADVRVGNKMHGSVGRSSQGCLGLF